MFNQVIRNRLRSDYRYRKIYHVGLSFAFMTSPHTPIARAYKRTPVSIDVVVNGVLNYVEGRITDLSEGGARIEGGVILPIRSRCEIHYGGQTVYAIVMWAEIDRMGVRFPYELVDGPLYNALERARGDIPSAPAQIFRTMRPTVFGRRGLN